MNECVQNTSEQGKKTHHKTYNRINQNKLRGFFCILAAGDFFPENFYEPNHDIIMAEGTVV